MPPQFGPRGLCPTSVFEVTLLRVISPPPDKRAIVKALQNVRDSLARNVHPTQSRFYSPINDPSLVYIFGIWDSLEDHHAFIDNEELREKVLGDQEGLLDFVWLIHVALPEQARDNGRTDGMVLPLDAPVLGFARLQHGRTYKIGERTVTEAPVEGVVKVTKMFMARDKGKGKWPTYMMERVDCDDEIAGPLELNILAGWEVGEQTFVEEGEDVDVVFLVDLEKEHAP